MKATPLSSRSFLVLGGAGFLGSHLSRALVVRGAHVRVFARPRTVASPRDLAYPLEVMRGDVANPDDVLDAMRGVDTVVHLVHTTVPGSSMTDPVHDIESNVIANVRWLRELERTSVERIVYVSSGGTVYGSVQHTPIHEGAETNPISSYGITKLAIEKYIALYAARAQRKHVIIRPSNVYGPGQRLDTGQGFIGMGLDRLLGGQPIEIWGDGSTVRDYVYVDDFVAAVLALVAYDGQHATFNVGSGEGHSLTIVASEMLRAANSARSNLVYCPQRSFDVPANVLDVSRMAQSTDWRPRVGLAEGIQRTADSIRANRGAGS